MTKFYSIPLLLLLFSFGSKAQKIEAIYFNLYTDSLKKGVYNYINVDGKLSNGKFIPLMSDELIFTSSIGSWIGNNLVLDTSIKAEKVTITATLRKKPELNKSVEIYLKIMNNDPILKTEKEVIESLRKKRS